MWDGANKTGTLVSEARSLLEAVDATRSDEDKPNAGK